LEINLLPGQAANEISDRRAGGVESKLCFKMSGESIFDLPAPLIRFEAKANLSLWIAAVNCQPF
jgi:hypothetical protein